MVIPVIGRYTVNDKIHFWDKNKILREGIIILIGLNGYVAASEGCVYILNDCDIKNKEGTLKPGEPLPSVDKAFGSGIAEYIAGRQKRIDYLESMLHSIHERICKNVEYRILECDKNDTYSLLYEEIIRKIESNENRRSNQSPA